MPPLKTFIFENRLNSNIRIEIKAYSFDRAKELVISTVKDYSDYQIVPN
jgi:hypothetical protein